MTRPLRQWISRQRTTNPEDAKWREARRRIRKARWTGSQKLDLSNLALTKLPAEIGQLTHLRYLDLSSNRLTKPPAEIGGLTSLQVLRSFLGGLTALPPEIGRLTNLQVLYLPMQGLSALPPEIGQLRNLRELNLYGSRLTRLPPEIGQLRNLEHLSLFGNPLVELPPQIGQLTNLRKLFVGTSHPSEGRDLTRVPAELGRLAKLELLSLHSRSLTRLPSELCQLTNLRSLYLENNRLTELPVEIGQLRNLEHLNLGGNELTEVPAEIGQLRNLKRLDLSSNRLTEVPAGLGKLTGLRSLTLVNNASRTEAGLGRLTRLRALTSLQELNLALNGLAIFPSELCDLTSTRDLDLSGNRLTELPVELSQLTNLGKLNLQQNQLTALPPELGQLANLQELNLQHNPLAEPLPELAEQGTDAVLAYLRSLVDAQARYEAKLLLVGEARAGKSTLVARLRGEPFKPGHSSTHGIELARLRMSHPTHRAMITLHTWDFGGQQLYQATHQLFLTRQAIYLLVWYPGQDDTDQVEAWLRRIKLHVGDQARVLLVATHADERVPVLDYAALQETFGALLADTFAVDSDSGVGLAALRSAIAEQAAGLPQMGEPLSERWVRARDQLVGQPGPHLPYRNYLAIGAEQGIEQAQADALLGLLHVRGQLIHYARDPWLKDLVVLQPEWLTKAISYVLDDEATKNAGGVLEHARLRELWQPYPAELHAYLLRLMERFDVCYRLDDDRSLVGQLVSEDRPPRDALPRRRRGDRVVSLRCVLEEEPPGLMAWLIVRNHHHATGWHWQRGVLLENSTAASRALLELLNPEPGQRERPELALTVYAPAPDYFFHVLVDSIVALLRHRWPGLGYQLRVPCLFRDASHRRCPGWFELNTLRQQLATGTATVSCPACGTTQNIGRLLPGVAASTRPGRAADVRGEQLDDFRDRLLEAVDDRVGQAERNIIATIAGAAGELRAELKKWTRWQQEGTGCPRLFTLTPADRRGVGKLAIGQDTYELTLWCEYLDQPHPWPKARYELRRAADWLVAVAPHALRVLRLLRLALQIAAPGVILVGGADRQTVAAQLDAMSKLIDPLPTHLPDHSADPGLADLADLAEGAELRALHALLNHLDPDRRYGGLQVAQTASEDMIWVCPEHYRLYHPGRPSLPDL